MVRHSTNNESCCTKLEKTYHKVIHTPSFNFVPNLNTKLVSCFKILPVPVGIGWSNTQLWHEPHNFTQLDPVWAVLSGKFKHTRLQAVNSYQAVLDSREALASPTVNRDIDQYQPRASLDTRSHTGTTPNSSLTVIGSQLRFQSMVLSGIK